MSRCNELRDRYQTHLKLSKKYRAFIKTKPYTSEFYYNRTSLSLKQLKLLASMASFMTLYITSTLSQRSL